MRRAEEKYDRLAGEYDQRWSTYITRSIEETTRRLSLEPGMRILDVACGTGKLLETLHRTTRSLSTTGIDLSFRMIRRAAHRLRHLPDRLVRAVAGDLPFRAGSFDLVVSTSSFHYFPKPDQVLGEIRELLSSDGELVITDWCSDYIVCRICDSLLRLFGSGHRRALRLDELRALLERNGFVIESIERYRFGLFWGMMTARATRIMPANRS